MLFNASLYVSLNAVQLHPFACTVTEESVTSDDEKYTTSNVSWWVDALFEPLTTSNGLRNCGYTDRSWRDYSEYAKRHYLMFVRHSHCHASPQTASSRRPACHYRCGCDRKGFAGDRCRYGSSSFSPSLRTRPANANAAVSANGSRGARTSRRQCGRSLRCSFADSSD